MATDVEIQDAIVAASDGVIEKAHIHPISKFFNGDVRVTSNNSRKYKQQLLKMELGFPADQIISEDLFREGSGYSLPIKNKHYKLVPFILFIKFAEEKEDKKENIK